MLLATDLDGTFLGGAPEDRLSLYQTIAAHPEIQLAYVSGRSLEAILPLLSDPTLPQPDYIVADVGASLYHGDTLQPIQALQDPIDECWPGESRIASAMSRFPEIVRQDEPQIRRCSYYCAPEQAESPELAALADELGCEMLYSAGRYLDFLPQGVNKGSSLQKLVEWLDIAHDDVLVAGDTMNDLAMLSAGFKAVCVGDAEPELLERTRPLPKVMHASAAGCGGIIEAFAHFGFLGARGLAAENRRDTAHTGKAELVMVYHRLPYEEYRVDGKIRRRRPTSPNGIIPTLQSFFANQRGSWIAWSIYEGDEEPEDFVVHTSVDAKQYPLLTAARVALTKEQVDIFYKRFSKEAFWPTLHTFWERARFREEDWDTYCEVNRAFAERTAEEAAEGALIWIHDYNLWMVPAYLRELRPDLRIAFFHHTYFPSADVFNVLPWRREIVGSLLQCDYVAFHIPRQVENFVDVARGVVPLTTLSRQNCAPRFLTYGCAVGLETMTTAIDTGTRVVRLGAHPVGLDLGRIRNALEQDGAEARMAELRDEFEGMKLILSVERLDYTKGILEKLKAYELLLDENPELRGKVTLVSICVPAAREMTIYDELQTQIEQTIGHINGRFADVGWTPVQFYFRGFPFEELMAWYAMADVMWITPLRDGLNLVAKEFVATQGLTQGCGVLVLSEFAGAAAELKGAILTNPHDLHDLARTCYLGLNLPRAEAQARLRQLNDIVEYNDIRRWGDEFIAAIKDEGDSGAST
ncbi:glucosylglycerol-phosphate synthase [Salinicola endophyticus]|uniref:Glucosylglycerol-phosphate synthase n=1 Tax=Salinicola endophyticus TaxID=1949083 RepID=A0ABY8FE99_9GAMM|nr:glucosylglycerol-phosphate synthase [Salinicola endophyticus]WFF41149.1 glucosylglycerol-phosphate synthase [Salinicola endophyticus]